MRCTIHASRKPPFCPSIRTRPGEIDAAILGS
jgi:hypothetical protein